MVERLEGRVLLSVVSFTGAGDGVSWEDPNNWSTGGVPQPSDDVTISLPAGRSVTLNDFVPPVHSVTASSPLTITNGILSIATTLSTSSNVTLVGGTLQNATVVGTGAATLNAGTMDGVTLNVPTVASLAQSGSPVVQVIDGLTVNNTLTVAPSVQSGLTVVDFHGSQTVGGAGSIMLTDKNNASLNLSDDGSPATLTVAPQLKIQGTGLVTGPADVTLVNQGTILANQAGQSLRIIPGNIVNQGTIDNQNGGVVGLSAGLNGTGSLSFPSGSVDLNGFAAAAVINVTGGTASLDTMLPVSIGSLNLSAGMIDGDAGLIINNAWSFTGGTMAGNGTTFLPQGATLNVANAVQHLVMRPFNNSGQVTVNAGTLELDANGTHSGNFSLATGTMLALGGTGAQRFQGPVTGTGTVQVMNSGSASVTDAYITNTTTVQDKGRLTLAGLNDRTNMLLVNGGSVQIGTPPNRTSRVATDQTVNVLTQHVITDGSTVVEPGWTLQDGGQGLQFLGAQNPQVSLVSDSVAGGRLLLGGDVSFAGSDGTGSIQSTGSGSFPGQIDLGGQVRSFTVNDGLGDEDFSISAQTVNGGIRKAGAGTMQITSSNSYASGTTLATGRLEADNAAALGAGALTFAGGTFVPRTGSNLALSNPLVVKPTDRISLDLGGTALQLATLTPGAALNVSGTTGSLSVSGNVTLQNKLVVNTLVPITFNGGVAGAFGITKAGAGTLTFAGGSNAYAGPTEVDGGALVLNCAAGTAIAGDLRINGPGTVSTLRDKQFQPTTNVTFDKSAGLPELDLNGHSQAVATINSFQTNAGTINLGAGTLSVGGGNYTGALLGTGTVSKESPGTLTLGGSLAGPALAVSGGAVAFLPQTGNTVRSLSITGGKVDLGNSRLFINYGAGPGPSASVRSMLASGALRASGEPTLGYADGADGVVAGLLGGMFVIKPALPGDANLDGKVNFSDLLLLAQHYNAPAQGWDHGDFNYDGTAGFADLLALAQNYNHTGPPAEALRRLKSVSRR